MSLKPGAAFRFTSAKDGVQEMQTSVVVEIPVHYLIPLTRNGEWNLQIVGGGGAGTDFSNSMFGLGAAYAPEDVPNIIIGLAFIADVTWPDAEFTKKVYALGDDDIIPDETWVTFGGEFALDFKTPLGFSGSLIAGAGIGIRGKPDTYYVAFEVPVGPTGTEERVKRIAD